VRFSIDQRNVDLDSGIKLFRDHRFAVTISIDGDVSRMTRSAPSKRAGSFARLANEWRRSYSPIARAGGGAPDCPFHR
jgi:hypothetical protein